MRGWLIVGSVLVTCSVWCATAAFAQRIVVVRENDTVWSLAKRYKVLPQDIVRANGLRNADSLQPGTRLRIPAPVVPKVVPATMRKKGVIRRDRVCVRYAPNRTDRSVTLLDKGHSVTVTARRGNWLQVRLSSGQTGWVREDLVTVTGTLGAKSPANTARKVAKRSQPSSTPKSKSTRAVALRRARMQASLARETEGGSSLGEVIVRTASRYQGVRYRWGGSSRSGFDCSGFTRYIYRQRAGIELPHSASAQFRRGTPVSREELQPGDLVFFQTYRRGASHVGIYIGNGKFIHASSARGRVRIDSLDEGYYRQRYLGARRITK
ncbi:MAG: NlpC/P60 family protein [Armatimonadota bacterium]|nr:NlpC/P60 family protein [bacterium]MCS7310372.1 NlpC/P60 family protein [Armatimonadota bacterium]MDW8103966.1 NlpC/P60 family protein [Armatimonadota bacterium]MDW8290839.1 NlpC/P60 family protein [Armatimonadota bacterium]